MYNDVHDTSYMVHDTISCIGQKQQSNMYRIDEPGTLNVTTYGYTGTCFPGSQMRLRTVQMQDRDAEESDLENPLIFCGRGRHIVISFALDGVTYSILVRLLIPIPVYDSVIDP